MPQPDLPQGIILADTATKLGESAAGAVIVTGSHGGRYAAYLTLKVHPRAVIHNDAGVGKEEAGIAVIAMVLLRMWLQRLRPDAPLQSVLLAKRRLDRLPRALRRSSVLRPIPGQRRG